MDKQIFYNIIISFRSIYKQETTLLNYVNYYNALVSWIKKHWGLLSKEQIENSRLDVLMNLDSDIYVIDNPELLLNQEYKRIGARTYETMDDLIMSVSDTLWDLVTIKSGINCPNCIDDELRYVIAEDKEKNIHELILECETCGWTEHIDGVQWKEGKVKIIPANINEVNHIVKKD